MIKIIGLGPGAPEALTIGAVKALEEGKNIYFRTEKHPTVDYLKGKIKNSRHMTIIMKRLKVLTRFTIALQKI